MMPVRRSLRLIRPGGSRCGCLRSARAIARPATTLDAPPQRPDEQFRPDGWFSTGDEYLRDAEGFYHHRGRTGDMLRVSGIWISPAEIEDALAGHASIAESAAVLGESDIGLAEIVLYVVPAAGADGSAAVAAAARERLSQALPRYKQPRRFEIVTDLPRTATGKIQRHKLRDLGAARCSLRPDRCRPTTATQRL